MQYRVDIKSGNNLSLLGFGVMRLPTTSLGKIDMKKCEELILCAIEHGINFFDTAYLYPGSEAALGNVLHKANKRQDVYISTKLPIAMCKSYEDFDKYFNIQLERLKTSYIDYYFMHFLSTPAEWERLMALNIDKWIEEKKNAGLIKQVGFSFHGSRDDFVKLIDIYPFDFSMIQYNYLNINYQAGQSGLKYAHSKGVPVFIMEPLLGGVLANNLPKKAMSILQSNGQNMSPADWALKWIFNQEEITMVLSGMNMVEHIVDNVKVANTLPNSMTDLELNIIERTIDVFAKSYKIPCTSCNYCMLCPMHINIPACFMAYNASYAISYVTGMSNYITTTGGLRQNPYYASHCTKCKKCEKYCPQGIKIADSLTLVKKRLEPFWIRGALKIARKFLSK